MLFITPSKVIGPDFPYFAAIGNHDIKKWGGNSGYHQLLLERLTRFGGDKYCSGEYGVNLACNYKVSMNIFILIRD